MSLFVFAKLILPYPGTVLFGLVYYDLFNEFIEKRNCFQLGNNKGRRGYVSPVGLSP